MSIKATIFNVSRCSVSDGPGIRTVVFFKGCNLNCEWCHNPEGLNFNSEISFTAKKCINCGRCKAVCKRGCFTENGFDRTNCITCKKCANECPSKALEVVGKTYTPIELYNEIIKDYHFFVHGGGVTLSGGECLCQSEFCCELLKLLKEKKINVIIESAFNVPQENVEKVIKYADTFYVDLKLVDSEKHKKYTGKNNKLILKNLERFCKETYVIVRVPLIPSVNDDIENLQQTVKLAKKFGAKGVELLKYNPLGVSKYDTLGKHGKTFSRESQTKEQIEKLVSTLNSFINENDYVYCII